MGSPSSESEQRFRANRRAECVGATPTTSPCAIDGARAYHLLNVRRCVFRVIDDDAGWSGNFALHFRLPESGGCYMELDDAFAGEPPLRLDLTRDAFDALSFLWRQAIDES